MGAAYGSGLRGSLEGLGGSMGAVGGSYGVGALGVL